MPYLGTTVTVMLWGCKQEVCWMYIALCIHKIHIKCFVSLEFNQSYPATILKYCLHVNAIYIIYSLQKHPQIIYPYTYQTV